MNEETGWLLELEGPKWFSVINGEVGWSANSELALRFARKQDADNFKAFWCATAVSTEHIWYA